MLTDWNSKSWQKVLQGRNWAPESGRRVMDHGLLGTVMPWEARAVKLGTLLCLEGLRRPRRDGDDVKIKAQKEASLLETWA